MGIRFDPDDPSGGTEPGFIARALNALRRAPDQPPATYQPPPAAAAAPRRGTLTPADVTRVRFSATKFREGYDQDEVDDFLDRVESTLREREAGRAGQLTADEVVNVRFQASRFREGYDQVEVDAFLDQVVQALA